MLLRESESVCVCVCESVRVCLSVFVAFVPAVVLQRICANGFSKNWGWNYFIRR